MAINESEVIRGFLLGRLEGAAQSRFEERLFADEGLDARVKLEEIALADDFARGYLSAADADRFRTKFMVTAERQRTVAVSRALRATFPVATSRRRTWFGFNRTVWRYAFAAFLLLLVLATVWRRVKEPSLVRDLIPKRFQPKPKPPVSQPVEAGHPQVNSPPAHVETSPPAPPHELVPRAITLDQNSSAQSPTVAAADVARFEIVLPPNHTGSFNLEVLSGNGESLFKADSLEANGSSLSVDMPGGLLKSGDYQVKVAQVGKEVMNYYFRVQ